ncbi:MAG TPA: FAD-dependent monooxygenase [Ktedonobacterales bacterium]|nr:FAD-dependent monooxygenase [Ktedonobacterales bacterium]
MSDATPLDALIVGAGPTGLTLAGALLRRGLRVRLVDSALASTSFSKAIGIQSRTMETFDLLGLADAFVAAGLPLNRASFASAGHEIGQVSFASLDSRYPYILTLPQSDTEEILGAWVTRLGGQIERGVTLETFTQRDASTPDGHSNQARIVATLRQADGASEQVEAAWLIGCDGAHSRVRHLVGATFHGAAYPGTYALADVRLDWKRPPDRARIFFHPDGLLAAFPLPGDRYRLIMDTARTSHGSHDSNDSANAASELSHPPAPTFDEVAAIVARRTEDAEARLSDPHWLASFRISARSVDHTRCGRIFLVGDAAHIHSPAGGQGMNTGIQDALNLGWKLALVQRGLAHDALLDSYEGERQPIAEAVIRETDALLRAATLRNPLMRFGRDSAFSLFTALPMVERRLVRQIAEVTITYRHSPLTQPGPALARGSHPGDFAPEVDGLLTPAGESTRLAALLRGGASLLLTCAPQGGPTREQTRELAAAIQPWGDALIGYRVAASLTVTSAADASHALPTLADPKGALRRAFGIGDDASALILIRPDGYLALHAEGARSIEALRAYTTRALESV